MSSKNAEFIRAEAEFVLDHARKLKSKKTKDLGSPLKPPGTPLAFIIRENDAWIAENTAQVRVLNLENGKTRSTFKGHTGPVTSIAFTDKVTGSRDNKIMITGSWDQTIRIWDIETKELISTTPAHSDFVKVLLVFPALNLLVSGGSDKVVRFWDLSTPTSKEPLTSVGNISSHTRPVECLEGEARPDNSVTLYTADTMGVIKIWELKKEDDAPTGRWKSTLKEDLNHHRTRINEMVVGGGYIWTASTDDTVQINPHPFSDSTQRRPIPPINHPTAVKALLPLQLTPLEEPYLITGSGDVIRTYDVSSLDSPPELLSTIDAHWHDVTILKLWLRLSEEGNVKRIEPWVVSASLDGTIRKWKLSELLDPPPSVVVETEVKPPAVSATGITDEELDELLNSDSE